jgi:hypothetical protein
MKALGKNDRCIWVGPPTMRKFNGTPLDSAYAMIEEAIELASKESGNAPCELIRSRPLSKYPAGKSGLDGIHYGYPGGGNRDGRPAAEAWARGVIPQLKL